MRVLNPALLAALGIAAVASGQSQAPAFRANTNVVQVDVRVFQGGHFVTGLGPADFTVTEDGVPQTIQSVVLVGAPSTPASSSSASAPAPPAAVAVSAPSAPSAPPSFWLFVFDIDHLSPAGLKHTQDAVLQFLDARWHQGDVGGVVADGRMANNRLTSDRGEIRTAVAAVRATGNPRALQRDLTQEWPRIQDEPELFRILDEDRSTIDTVTTRACVDDPGACKREAPDAAVREKARRIGTILQQSSLKTLSSVEALANGLARMAGPKTIVFVSEGFVIEKLEGPLRQAVGDAGRAGAHFYTIDARGLDHGSADSSNIDRMQAESLIGRTAHFDDQADGTTSLAVDTGGLAIRNENDFGRALDEIQRDAATYYIVGYTPTNTTFDGKYRSISVKVDKPGLQVRARRGYLAVAPAMLLAPHPAGRVKGTEGVIGAAAAPKDEVAADLVPNVPVMPGVGTLVPGLPAEAVAAANAMRTRVESGVLTLKKFAAADVAAGDADRGWAAYERGDVVTAATELSAAAAAADKPWISYALGYAQYAQQKYQAAAEAWTRVNKAAPEFEPVYFNLADALSLQGKETDAINVLRMAERRWPADAEVEDAIGVIEVRRIALDAAIKSFDRATKLAPADPVGYFNLGRAYQMRFAKAQRYDAAEEKWIGDESDRDKSIAAYQRSLELHGPYEEQAREAIAMLQWKK